MSTYLKITNPGVCHPEAFTVLGVSTARGKSEKIGQFGSGAKQGINVCLRHGIKPIIISGGNCIYFDHVKKRMGDQPYDQVVAVINGQRHELGFALQFGELDWNNVQYGIREFISNARDQGGCNLEVVDNIDHNSDNETSVYVSYTDDVKSYIDNLSKYFLPSENTQQVLDSNCGELRVYRKNVLVYSEPRKALFSYNLDKLKVDESRNADKFTVKYYCAMAFGSLNDQQRLSFLSALIDNVDCFEVRDLDYDYIYSYSNNADMVRVYEEKFGGLITTPELSAFCQNKHTNIRVVSEKAYTLLRRFGIKIAKVKGGVKGTESNYVPIDVTKDCRRMFVKAWNTIVKYGMSGGKSMPELSMYVRPLSSGSNIRGYYEDGVVYIERDNVIMQVIIEEIGHYVTGADDATRDFQDWAFKLAACLI